MSTSKITVAPCDQSYRWCRRRACRGFFVVEDGARILGHHETMEEAFAAAGLEAPPIRPAAGIYTRTRAFDGGPLGRIALCEQHHEELSGTGPQQLTGPVWNQLDEYECYGASPRTPCMWCQSLGQPERLRQLMTAYAHALAACCQRTGGAS